jgi:hypothetical protein
MAKKDLKARDDEDDDLDDDQDDDPDAGVPIAKGQKPPPPAKGRARASAAHEPKPSHEGKGHGHGHDEGIDDESVDPQWWTPYATLGVIVLVGVLGFFGTFNPWLKKYFSPMPQSSAQAEHGLPSPPTPQPPAAPMPAPAATGAADTFGAKHLLVMYKGSRRAPDSITRTKEEALARAKEAHGKATKPGAKFEDVVAEYSDEPNAAKRGGNLGNFRKGAMVKEFQDGLEKLKVGEIGAPLETPFGYHVILRTK